MCYVHPNENVWIRLCAHVETGPNSNAKIKHRVFFVLTVEKTAK